MAVSPDPLQILGTPVAGGIAIIADHASNHVPDGVDLGIAPALLTDHIAVDIGTAAVAALLVRRVANSWAMLGGQSRLVIDLNREEEHDGLIPLVSDGHAIPGNAALSAAERAARVARFYRPYHAGVADLLAANPPAFILSLHSFTPRLASAPQTHRPWDMGVLYGADDRLAARTIAGLADDGWHVGDQLPYSGRRLNATMNRHAEARGIPYIGMEMRQDHCAEPLGQSRMAASLIKILGKLMQHPCVRARDLKQGAPIIASAGGISRHGL